MSDTPSTEELVKTLALGMLHAGGHIDTVGDLAKQRLAAHDRQVRAEERERVAQRIEARLDRPVHPYGDETLGTVPERAFLDDAYGPLASDILAVARGV